MSSNISFPVDLPTPLRDSYSETYEQIHGATDMETGPSRRRARMRSAPRRFNINLSLNQAEFTVFDNWWQDVVLGGAVQFDIRMLDEDDVDPLVWYTVNVVDGQYKLNVSKVLDYDISFAVRSIGPSFTTRVSGTDSLRGATKLGLRDARARILTYPPFRGSAILGLRAARAIIIAPPLRGNAIVGPIARARFT